MSINAIMGQPVSLGAGAADAGTLRVIPASDAAATLPTGAATEAKQDTGNTSLASVDAKLPASVAHDAADSGNPLKTGSKAAATLSTATLVAAADRADRVADLDGAIIVRPHATLADLVNGTASNTDGTSTQCIAAQGAGVKTYLTDVTLSNTSATAVEVVIKDGTTAKWTFPVPANTAGVTFSFASPLAGTANTAWNFDPASAVDAITCSMSGFKSKI